MNEVRSRKARRWIGTLAGLASALVLSLVLAAGASAEIRTGEGTLRGDPSIPAEFNLLGGKAEYDTTTGTARIIATTAAEPRPEAGGEPSGYSLTTALIDTTSVCSLFAISSGAFNPPFLELEAPYREATGKALFVTTPGVSEEPLGPVAKSVTGTTTTLEFGSPRAVGQGYDCAVLIVADFEAGEASEYLFFPIAAAPPATPPVPPAPTPAPPASTPAPAPAAPALSIAEPKLQTLAVDKWKTVRLKVTNTGTAGTATGSLRVKAPKGVLVKPEKQRLPVLAPGQSWTVSVRVELTPTAKKKATLALTATASGVTGRGSLVLKRKQQRAAGQEGA